jgi:hypothetical protein
MPDGQAKAESSAAKQLKMIRRDLAHVHKAEDVLHTAVKEFIGAYRNRKGASQEVAQAWTENANNGFLKLSRRIASLDPEARSRLERAEDGTMRMAMEGRRARFYFAKTRQGFIDAANNIRKKTTALRGKNEVAWQSASYAVLDYMPTMKHKYNMGLSWAWSVADMWISSIGQDLMTEQWDVFPELVFGKARAVLHDREKPTKSPNSIMVPVKTSQTAASAAHSAMTEPSGSECP